MTKLLFLIARLFFGSDTPSPEPAIAQVAEMDRQEAKAIRVMMKNRSGKVWKRRSR